MGRVSYSGRPRRAGDLRRPYRIARRVCAGWLIAVALPSCAFTPPAPRPPPSPGPAALFVIDRGWHTDIGVPVLGPGGQLRVFQTVFPGARYLVFGFGERVFYTGKNQDFAAMLRALFPSRAAILITALRDPPAEAFGADNVVGLHLSWAAANRVVQFILDEFAHDRDGRPRLLAYGPYPGSLFYASSGTYDALHTCNTWTAEALDAAGLPIRSFGTVFANQVMDQVRDINSTGPGLHRLY